MTSGRGRYAAAGAVYDLVSLERVLYRHPRLRLVQLLALPAAATVLDLGCGTRLNLAPVLAAVAGTYHPPAAATGRAGPGG